MLDAVGEQAAVGKFRERIVARAPRIARLIAALEGVRKDDRYELAGLPAAVANRGHVQRVKLRPSIGMLGAYGGIETRLGLLVPQIVAEFDTVDIPEQLARVAAHQGLGAEARQPMEGRVDTADHARAVSHHDRVGGGIQYRREKCFCLRHIA